ncbi:MAG: lactate utilization protein [Lachnospiraceae bacterium]|nr:lactate utilization protein [Lachnospiraceae bacterium]
MNENIVKRNEKLAQKVIRGLESRNMTGYYAKTKEEALKTALALIPEGSRIARGGSMSVNEIGLSDALEAGNYDYRNREKNRDPGLDEFAFTADIYLAGSNAVTEDGVLVNIDGNSNRVSSIAYGPKKVILIVGMNKIAPDVDAAMKRARNIAAPVNAQRFGLSTPCSANGSCMNCKSPDTICCQFLITRFSRHKDRIHVILVGEDLGF